MHTLFFLKIRSRRAGLMEQILALSTEVLVNRLIYRLFFFFFFFFFFCYLSNMWSHVMVLSVQCITLFEGSSVDVNILNREACPM